MTSYQKTLYKIFINIPQAMQIVVPVDNVKQCETSRDETTRYSAELIVKFAKSIFGHWIRVKSVGIAIKAGKNSQFKPVENRELPTSNPKCVGSTLLHLPLAS